MPIYSLSRALRFPPPQNADEGLLAVGGDLSRERLLLAYSSGIFPWYSHGEPILWWSPDPRMVLFPEEHYASKRLRRTLRSGRFEFSMDEAFGAVIEACATAPRPGQDGTWITEEMEAAYIDLHHAGYAHSVECWQADELAGGLYGVSLGACFFGESMFSDERDASKAGMAVLVEQCKRWGIRFIDCQVANPHLERLGAREIPRDSFLGLLKEGLQSPTRRGQWSLEQEAVEAAGRAMPES